MAWSLPELSAALGLSIGFLRKEVRRGVLRTTRVGRRVIVLEADLQKFLGREHVENT
jgi:excisionase family DNA binding protein